MVKYCIVELDVWVGEEKGLWEINNALKTDSIIELKDPYNVREVLSKVRKEGYNLKAGKYTTNINEFCDSELFEIIVRTTQQPILQLELVEE